MDPVRESQDVTSEAYHGTKEHIAGEIIKNGFCLPPVGSPEGRYGRAVYFWLNSKDQAVWWAKKTCNRGDVIAVIRAKAAYGRHLNIVSWDGQKLLAKVARNLAVATSAQTVTEAAALNFMAHKGWIETALVLDFPEQTPVKVFTGSYSVQGPRLILCVYRVEKILERTIVLTEAA